MTRIRSQFLFTSILLSFWRLVMRHPEKSKAIAKVIRRATDELEEVIFAVE